MWECEFAISCGAKGAQILRFTLRVCIFASNFIAVLSEPLHVDRGSQTYELGLASCMSNSVTAYSPHSPQMSPDASGWSGTTTQEGMLFN